MQKKAVALFFFFKDTITACQKYCCTKSAITAWGQTPNKTLSDYENIQKLNNLPNITTLSSCCIFCQYTACFHRR